MIYSKQYGIEYKEEDLDIMDFTPIYGDLIFNELYKQLDKEPSQYEYDYAIDSEYSFFINKISVLAEAYRT